MARGADNQWDVECLRDRYITAALEVLQETGPESFTLRRVAERAGVSTMGVYTRFEGRPGLVRAVCDSGVSQLRDHLLVALRYPHRAAFAARGTKGHHEHGRDDRGREHDGPNGPGPVFVLALAYREFALRHPHLHALLSVRGSESTPGAYLRIRELCCGLLAEALAEPTPSGTCGPGAGGPEPGRSTPGHGAVPGRPTGQVHGCPADQVDLLWACVHGLVCTEREQGSTGTSPEGQTSSGAERLVTGVRAMLAGLGRDL